MPATHSRSSILVRYYYVTNFPQGILQIQCFSSHPCALLSAQAVLDAWLFKLQLFKLKVFGRYQGLFLPALGASSTRTILQTCSCTRCLWYPRSTSSTSASSILLFRSPPLGPTLSVPRDAGSVSHSNYRVYVLPSFVSYILKLCC